MVMSIERVFTRHCPKSTSPGQSIFRRSVNPIQSEDILVILGTVQHAHPLGVRVLNAQIGNDHGDRTMVVGAIHRVLVDKQIENDIARAMANAVVFEVCDAPACQTCRGNGIHPKLGGIEPCPRCEGSGRLNPSERNILRVINCHLTAEDEITRHRFRTKLYPLYMDMVDKLLVAANEASHAIRRHLRTFEE